MNIGRERSIFILLSQKWTISLLITVEGCFKLSWIVCGLVPLLKLIPLERALSSVQHTWVRKKLHVFFSPVYTAQTNPGWAWLNLLKFSVDVRARRTRVTSTDVCVLSKNRSKQLKWRMCVTKETSVCK